ncbi:MAG TPA: polysaccharide deacetylase family protein [Thermomicrobiaceae bacterium]|nr:polysaccharide deacetylase family protein [Thermomicrobiaceae bacterium]
MERQEGCRCVKLRSGHRFRLLIGPLLALALLFAPSLTTHSSAAALPSQVYFPVTGHHVADQMLTYWRTQGELPIFGYPLTEPIQRDGLTVQYFERARLELHPELAGTPYGVELTLLGDQAVAGRKEAAFQRAGGNGANDSKDRVYFSTTGHYLAYGFKSFWQANGGLAIFGYPISEEFSEKNPDNGQIYTVQYFERARFEYHPEFKGTPYEVELGRLGAAAAARDEVPVAAVPRQDGVPDYDPALFAPHPQSIHIPVLMYHQIGPNAARYVTPLWLFDQEMDWLKDNGYHTVTVAQLYDYVLTGGTLPAKPVVITFDDGTAGQWDAAAALDQRGMHGVFFIPTGFSALSPDQLRSLNARGHEIESHTVTHPFLTQVSDSQLNYEMVQSKSWLGSVLGKPVHYVAYPYGDYNNQVIDAAANAGYSGALAAWGGQDWTPAKRWQEPRVEVSGLLSISDFAGLVRG